MKLYAQVTSDRASKGQGGNKEIGVLFKVEKGRKNYVNLASIYLTVDKYEGETRYYLQLIDERNGKLVYQFCEPAQTKGEKQKGDKCQHNYCDDNAVCIKCGQQQ